MFAVPELRTLSSPGRPSPRRGAFFRAAAASLAMAGLIACATMDGITKRTADSPAASLGAAGQGDETAGAPSAPSIPAELQTAGRAWTLVDIVDVGLSNNPGTRAAWNAARAASAAVGISLGAYLPQIEATLPGTKQKMAFAGGRFIIDQTTLTPTASLNLLLFDFGGREADVRSARLALEAANWTQNAALQNAILQIESVYYQYLSAKALLEAQETSRKGAQANYDAANDRHRAGVATIADVLQAKTALSDDRPPDRDDARAPADAPRRPGQLDGTPGRRRVRGRRGASRGHPVRVRGQAGRPLHPGRGSQAAGPGGGARPGLEAEAGVRMARSTFFPAFTLSGNIGRIYYHGNQPSNPFYSISLSVNLPFLFGLQQYAVLAAKAQAEVARDQMTELGRGIELQVWTSYYGLKTSEQEIMTARDLLASAQASHDVALGRYKEGVGSILDLLAAESVLENARVQLVQARSDWFLALVQFTHDTGTLEPPAAPAKPVLPAIPEKGDHRP